jgi:lysophospholipase L1-like esterase
MKKFSCSSLFAVSLPFFFSQTKKNQSLENRRMKARYQIAISLFPFLFFFSFCSSSERGKVVLCAGDSLTDSSYPRHLQNVLRSVGIRAKVLNYGRSGHTSGEYLRFLMDNEELLASERPDFILLQLGTNDVRVDHDRTSKNLFYENMNKILARFDRFRNPDGNNAQVLIATVPPIPADIPFPFSLESRKRVENEINPLIVQIGKERKIPVVDNTTLFIENPGLLSDVHPSEEGYKLLARNWFTALEPLLK